jgi:DNA replication and repair protein RecF
MLKDFRLSNFRPFEQLAFVPRPGPNFLIGDNAQGKTSLLEAVCLLLRLQSPRTNLPSECARFGSGHFVIHGHYQSHHLQLQWQGRLKHFALDSKPQSTTADYLSVARVAWIANSDMGLVGGPSAGRRRFLDFLGAQLMPGYIKTLRFYERSLRARNALLKHQAPAREVAAFDEPLAEAGDTLTQFRSQVCADFLEHARFAYERIAGGREELRVEFVPGCAGPMRDALWESRGEEARLRHTVVGPHRDELALFLAGCEASRYGSEGQQRSVALALKVGQALRITEATGTPPLYLVDDVFGELDASRRHNLLSLLPSEAQMLITTTATSWLGEVPWNAPRFRVANGAVVPMDS